MPTELRHLIFKSSELVEGILDYRRAHRVDTPRGSVSSFDVDENPDGEPERIRLTITPDAAGAPPYLINLARADIISVMLKCCQERRIPIPMRGSKVLARFGTKLGLVITVG